MIKENSVVLIYKRTHMGDPDERGIFGINSCMGRVRNWKFDAVIGIGGKKPWKRDEGISNKINYVGLGAKKHSINSQDGHRHVSFEKFILFDDKGKEVKDIAPKLYEYLYRKNVRVVKLDKTSQYWNEVAEILKLADNAKPSSIHEHLETATNMPQPTSDVQCCSKHSYNKIKGCCRRK